MFTVINKIRFWIYIVWLSFLHIFQTVLGSKVLYKGKVYIVRNGVRSEMWRLDQLDNNDNGWVRRKNCKFIISWENIKHNFLSMYNFYMTSWYKIWVRNGVSNWCKGCKIWPKLFYRKRQ